MVKILLFLLTFEKYFETDLRYSLSDSLGLGLVDLLYRSFLHNFDLKLIVFFLLSLNTGLLILFSWEFSRLFSTTDDRQITYSFVLKSLHRSLIISVLILFYFFFIVARQTF